MEPRMDVQIIGLTSGFVLIAIALVKMAIEHRSDVLHGPYLNQKNRGRFWPMHRRRSVDTALDRFRLLEAMRRDQLAFGAC